LAALVAVLVFLTVAEDKAETPQDTYIAPKGSALQATIHAVHMGDADLLLSSAETFNLCDLSYREPHPECANTDHVDAVWQIGYGTQPVARTDAVMRRLVSVLLDANPATVLFVGHALSSGEPTLVILRFEELRRIDEPQDGPLFDLLALRVSEPSRQSSVEQTGFFAVSDLTGSFAVDILQMMAGYRPVIDFCAEVIAAVCWHIAFAPTPTPTGPVH
jgi:hypothetical protein